jgi:hypothetical protein
MAPKTFDVGTLAARVGLSIATTSQHLGTLRIAEVISLGATAGTPATPSTTRTC